MKSFYVFIVGALFLTCCARLDKSSFKSPIVSIGGCDSFGMCGVKLQNGIILSDVRQPVIGSFPDCKDPLTCNEVLQ